MPGIKPGMTGESPRKCATGMTVERQHPSPTPGMTGVSVEKPGMTGQTGALLGRSPAAIC
jgi:hypothetical protein